ncbi:TetR family transcriptional regulator, partial [Streptomyces goshikiensis]
PRARARALIELPVAGAPRRSPPRHDPGGGLGARARATAILAGLGAERPEEAAELLVGWTEGILYDRLAGALARSRPAPDLAELTSVARRMVDAALL